MNKFLILVVLFAVACSGCSRTATTSCVECGNRIEGKNEAFCEDCQGAGIVIKPDSTVNEAGADLNKEMDLPLAGDDQNAIPFFTEELSLETKTGTNLDSMRAEVNSTGTITDQQAEILGKSFLKLELNGLTSITDEQAESLSRIGGLYLNGLATITGKQAETLSKDKFFLGLSGLTSITDEQAESLSKVGCLYLNSLTSITDNQANSLMKVTQRLKLQGLTEITDQQAKSLAKVHNLIISEACQKQIDKYKNQDNTDPKKKSENKEPQVKQQGTSSKTTRNLK